MRRLPANTTQLATATPAFESIDLAVGDMRRPNGVGVSSDGKRLYVSSSDHAEPQWRVYDLDRHSGALSNGKQLADGLAVRQRLEEYMQTLPANQRLPVLANPDGFVVVGQPAPAGQGELLVATGPGGVLVFDAASGELLGLFATGVKTGNVALGHDGYLYVAADSELCRVPTKLKPA